MANPYMPFYTGDYLRKTRRLIDREHGAYVLILFALWDEGGQLPFDMDELRAIARVPVKAKHWPDTWAKIAPFFVIENGMVRHRRVDETLAEVALKRQSYAERGAKGGAAKRKIRKQNSATNQAELKPSSSNQTKGLVSSLREEKPNLGGSSETIAQAASTPSPEMGGVDAPASEELKPLRMWLQSRVQGLMVAHVLSARDVRDLKDALRGGSEECLLLASTYKPPDHVASALESICIEWASMPALKAIEGGKQ